MKAESHARHVPATLRLIGSFELTRDGTPIDLPKAAQRVVAFLGIHARRLQRSFVAGTLWPTVDEARAAANLRSTLWRLAPPARGVVVTEGASISLAPHVRVDLHEVRETATRIVISGRDCPPEARAVFEEDLLPDWYEEWVEAARREFHQLRLHALESLGDALVTAGRPASAIEVGLRAVIAEPLRESARRVLIRAYLAEGNTAEAMRQYHDFRTVIERDLGVVPSGMIEELVRPIMAR